MKLAKVGAFLVSIGLVLSGCTEIPNAEEESTQENSAVESQAPEESTESETEPLEPEPTPSELEACETVPQLMTLAKEMNGGDGPVEISEVTLEFSHLQAVTTLLAEEASTIAEPVESFVGQFGSVYPILSTNAFGTSASLTSGMQGLDLGLTKLTEACVELGIMTDFESLPRSAEAFYPDGFWFEVVTEDFLNYGLVSNDDIWDVSLEADEVFFETSGKKALSLNFTCDVTSQYFNVLVSRITGDFDEDVFGPSGKTEFLYSLDGTPQLSANGYFQGGLLWPFTSSSSGLSSNGERTWEAFSGAEKSIEIEMDVPGARFTHKFSVIGMDIVGKELNSAGCFGF